eukprot:TRINITY_DN5681_c0_g1_i1.p1 TRINITY_DN5681_c0_g1~~TRINITY_DN5681_c0_g1_i1.p1  ORF type:complete len:284 (-),score=49.02 TRINITY_DN5681_c0_g1_i1:5-808(-)
MSDISGAEVLKFGSQKVGRVDHMQTICYVVNIDESIMGRSLHVFARCMRPISVFVQKEKQSSHSGRNPDRRESQSRTFVGRPYKDSHADRWVCCVSLSAFNLGSPGRWLIGVEGNFGANETAQRFNLVVNLGEECRTELRTPSNFLLKYGPECQKFFYFFVPHTIPSISFSLSQLRNPTLSASGTSSIPPSALIAGPSSPRNTLTTSNSPSVSPSNGAHYPQIIDEEDEEAADEESIHDKPLILLLKFDGCPSENNYDHRFETRTLR